MKRTRRTPRHASALAESLWSETNKELRPKTVQIPRLTTDSGSRKSVCHHGAPPKIADVSKKASHKSTAWQHSQTCSNEQQYATLRPAWCTTLVAPKPISMTTNFLPSSEALTHAHTGVTNHSLRCLRCCSLHGVTDSGTKKTKQKRAVTKHHALNMQEATLTSVGEQRLAKSSNKQTRNKNVSFDIVVNDDENTQRLLIDFSIGEGTTTTSLAHSWTRPNGPRTLLAWTMVLDSIRFGVMPRCTHNDHHSPPPVNGHLPHSR